MKTQKGNLMRGWYCVEFNEKSLLSPGTTVELSLGQARALARYEGKVIRSQYHPWVRFCDWWIETCKWWSYYY